MKLLYIYLVIFACLSCSKKEEEKIKSIDESYYNSAYKFLDSNLSDSAYLMFSQIKDLYTEVNDSLNIANCLINMSIIQKDQGDYFGAQETALQAVDYMIETNPKHHIYISTNYNNLGVATTALNEYKRAIPFYEKAIQFSNDSLNTFIYKNNLAICYQNILEYNKAIEIYEDLLNKVKSNRKRYARVLSNLARTRWLKDKNYQAEKELLRALSIREKEEDWWGLNASYVHLVDFYSSGNINSALFYAKKMYNVSERLQSPDDRIYALSKLIELAPSNSTKDYFKIYQRLDDSLQTARAAAKNQFALIRYEVEKNKTDNLRLQKENAEKQGRLIKQRAITGGTMLLFVLAISGGGIWYKKRKQRLELEAQNRVKETQLHLSKKIHDVVANGIYRVMTEIEYKANIDRDGVLDKLEDMYNKSRDISHEVEQQTEEEVAFNERLAELLKSFATEERLILIAGNDALQWIDVNVRVQEEIRQVLQELMVNMKKHSMANRVVVRFERTNNQLKIAYKDDGIGMSIDKPKGKGLANTVSRIESLGGEIIFVSEPGDGFSAKINIPIV